MPLTESGPGAAWTAEVVVHAAVQEERSPEAILDRLEAQREVLVGEEQERISQYIVGIRPVLRGVLVEELEPQVAGEFDGSNITIAASTLDVRGSIGETLAAAQETKEHEAYHQKHDHTQSLIAGSSADGETVATIGGRAFTETALIEGLTVAKTGQRFVSQEYVRYAGDVRSAVAAAGFSLNALEEAVDGGDLREVDDEGTKDKLLRQ